MRRTIIVACTLILIGIAPAAHGSDGCFEISHVNVGSVGALTTPGCYVLTSDITQGLTIGPVNGLSLDLNGFSIAVVGTPAVAITGSVENLEITGGTLWATGMAAAVDTAGLVRGVNHVFRNLRIQSDASGVLYQLQDTELDNIQLENVVIVAGETGFQLLGVDGGNVVRNVRLHRTEVRSIAGDAVSVLGTAPVIALQVYGFQLESSSIVTTSGLAAVHISTAGVTGPDVQSAEFEGSIRQCDLIAPESSTLGIVTFDARSGSLRCHDNHVVAALTGMAVASAFNAPNAAILVIKNNTSTVATAGPPAIGTVVSPRIGHDGTNAVFSNFDTFSGEY